MLTADQKAHFATFGFLTVRKAFSAGEMEEIIADAETVWGKDREGRASREKGQHITKFVEQGQALIRMVSDDRIAGAVEDLIGPDFLWAGLSTTSDYVRVMDQRLCQWLLCQANSYPVR